MIIWSKNRDKGTSTTESGRNTRVCSLQLWLLAFTLPSPLLASVESILVKDFPILEGKTVGRLFISDHSNERVLREGLVPTHLIPLDKFGQFDWPRWNTKNSNPVLSMQDELVFETRKPLNIAGKSNSPTGCKKLFSTPTRSIYECDRVLGKVEVSKVFFSETTSSLDSSEYRYVFDPKNKMLFKSIEVDHDQNSTLVAQNSDLLIRGDLKRFFSLNFDASDIKSVFKNKMVEPLGFFGSLGFYLQIAFFKVSLDLTTDVRFYADAAEIPMVLNFPVSPSKHLHPGSGIFYSYELGPSVVLNAKSMPSLKESATSVRESFCRENSLCEFKLDYVVLDESKSMTRAQMSFLFSQDMVLAGAYPIYSADAVDLLSSMKWPVPKRYRKTNRQGIFIDISGLSEGEHKWQFKLKILPAKK